MARCRANQELARRFGAKRSGNQKRIAEATGISQPWLSRLAEDARANLTDAMALKRVAGIELEWWDQPPLTERARPRRGATA